MSSAVRARRPPAALLADAIGMPQLPPRRRWPRWSVAGVIMGVLVAAVAAGWLGGLRAFVVESPSMGRAAPVGTFVIGTNRGEVGVGDLITFHPPGADVAPYTHRIVSATADGFHTRGDINGEDDPWTVTRPMIISRALAELPGVGWLLKAAPIVLGALVLAQIVSLLLRDPSVRWSLRLLAIVLGVAGFSWLCRPLSGWTLLQSVSRADGMHATIVSTGLLPIRMSAVGGRSIELTAGEVGTVLLPRSAGGHVGLTSTLALDPLGWGLLALACLLPVLVVLVFGVPVADRRDADGA